MSERKRSCLPALLLAAIVIPSGCSSGRPDSAADQNASMIRAYVDALNRGDESYLDEYFGPGYVYHGPNGDLDLEGFKALHHSLLTAFSNGTMTAEDIVAAGDEVATRWSFHGIQSGEFQGVAPTGREVTLSGIIISRFQDGRAVEEWEQLDRLGMMQQLGVLPAPGAAADSGK